MRAKPKQGIIHVQITWDMMYFEKIQSKKNVNWIISEAIIRTQ